MTKPVFAHMRQRRSGVIIGVSSPTGLVGNFGQANYGAAKAGIWSLMKNLAIEGTDRETREPFIRVFTVVPVAFTRMTEGLAPFQSEQAKAQADPKFAAPLVVYLASDLSAHMTGKTFRILGGQIQEMKMVTSDGVTKTGEGGLWAPEEIGDQIDDILLPEKEPAAAS